MVYVNLYVISKLIIVMLITTLEWFNFKPIGPLIVKSCMVSLVSERSSTTAQQTK